MRKAPPADAADLGRAPDHYISARNRAKSLHWPMLLNITVRDC